MHVNDATVGGILKPLILTIYHTVLRVFRYTLLQLCAMVQKQARQWSSSSKK